MTNTTPNLNEVRAMMRIESQLQRATNRLVGMNRRLARDGFGRNEAATRAGLESHLRLGNEAIREMVNNTTYREERHGRLIERFWIQERAALEHLR